MKNLAANIFLVFALCLSVITIGSIFWAKKNHQETFILGLKPYIIKTGSMSPTLEVNGLVLVKKGGFENLKKSQIVVFNRPGLREPVSHRLIDFNATGDLITKGDNNHTHDDFTITPDKYLGKVIWYTNLPAYFIQNTKSPVGIMLISIPIIITIILFASWQLLFKFDRDSSVVEASSNPILKKGKIYHQK